MNPPRRAPLSQTEGSQESEAVDGADSTSCRREVTSRTHVRDVAHVHNAASSTSGTTPPRAPRLSRPAIHRTWAPGKGCANVAARPRPSLRLLLHISAHPSAHPQDDGSLSTVRVWRGGSIVSITPCVTRSVTPFFFISHQSNSNA
jgi:hypothetical protein